MSQDGIWSGVGEIVAQAWKELKSELGQDPQDANLNRFNAACDRLLEDVVRKVEDREDGPGMLHQARELKAMRLDEMVQILKQVPRYQKDEFIAQARNFKMLLMKGFFKSDHAVQCLDVILDRLGSNIALRDSSNNHNELGELRKENALLKQTTNFLKEEVEFFKVKKEFEQKRVSIESITDTKLKQGVAARRPSKDDKIISVLTLTKPQNKSKTGLLQYELARLPKSMITSKPSSYIKKVDTRKNSVTTLKSEFISEHMLDLSDQKDVLALMEENRELLVENSKLKSDLRCLQSKYQEVSEDRVHTVSMMQLDSNNVVEQLKSQLETIKASHRQEKESMSKRCQEEIDRAKKRISEIESSVAQKAAMIAQESEHRYNEMVAALRSSLESTIYELGDTKDKLKDVLDQKRTESVRYESKIQELKAEIRKAEARYETVKRKAKEDEFFTWTKEANKKAEVVFNGVKSGRNLAGYINYDKFSCELLNTKYLTSIDGTELTGRTSGKQLNFNDVDFTNSGTLSNSKQKNILDSQFPAVDTNEESLEIIRSSPMVMYNKKSGGSQFAYKGVARRSPLKINITDEDLLCSSTKFSQIKSTQASRENFLHADITNYFNGMPRTNKSNSKLNIFDAGNSAKTMKQSNRNLDTVSNSNYGKKHEMSPSSVSKPLDYFLKKKLSLNGHL